MSDIALRNWVDQLSEALEKRVKPALKVVKFAISTGSAVERRARAGKIGGGGWLQEPEITVDLGRHRNGPMHDDLCIQVAHIYGPTVRRA